MGRTKPRKKKGSGGLVKVFHGTAAALAPDLRKRGLVAGQGQPGVWVTTSIPIAVGYALEMTGHFIHAHQGDYRFAVAMARVPRQALILEPRSGAFGLRDDTRENFIVRMSRLPVRAVIEQPADIEIVPGPPPCRASRYCPLGGPGCWEEHQDDYAVSLGPVEAPHERPAVVSQRVVERVLRDVDWARRRAA